MQLPNRVVLEPHGLNYAHWDTLLPTRRHRDYYRARAAGGTGLICTESSVCSRDGQNVPLVLSSQSAAIPMYTEIAAAVHAEGAKISGQITHFGHQANLGVTRRPPISPSAVPDPLVRQVAHPMDEHDMARVLQDFVASARNFVAAGFDAVELKLAHDGLLRHFMSPLTNDRADNFGGSAENRLRYPLEVATAVRAEIGDRIALMVRLVLDEHLPGGYGIDEGVEFARLLAQSGLVDCINSDVGTTASMEMIVPPMGVIEGYAEPAFARVTAMVDIPVIACGQISSPAYAERALSEGKAHAVGMARQLLAEPDWAKKAFSGRVAQIRPCTRCNQLCVGNAVKFLPISCTVNPLAGYGETLVRAANAPKRVVVLGGGPAGMEAARVAASDGHAVTLFEASAKLGGQLALAATTAGRHEWRRYLDWLERELLRLGVAVATSQRASADEIVALEAESLVVATGSSPGTSAMAGPNAISLDSFIADRPGFQRAVFADLGAAGAPLWTTALEAAERRQGTVTLVTPVDVVAGDLDFATHRMLRARLGGAGVVALTQHVVSAVSDDAVTVVSSYSGAETQIEADLVVASVPRISRMPELRGLPSDVDVSVIGDAYAPRDAAAAIREGQEAGALLAREDPSGRMLEGVNRL